MRKNNQKEEKDSDEKGNVFSTRLQHFDLESESERERERERMRMPPTNKKGCCSLFFIL